MPDIAIAARAPTGNRAAVRRYRAKNKRIDYVPAAPVLAVINEWRAKGLSNCAAGVIDALVLAGASGMSGHSSASANADPC